MGIERTGHSAMFEQIREWYDAGRWSKIRVNNAVGKRITAEEYEEITGEPYDG